MYYPEDIIRDVRERTDIVGLVSGYVSLQKKGSNYFGCCPFHNEKTPSFSVNTKEQFFYCFGCHKGGNVITFLMEMENLTFPEALKELADRAGVTLPEAELSPEEKRRIEARTRLYDMNREAARFFYYQLAKTPDGARAREYLEQRGVTETYAKRFGLGYAPIGSASLYRYLSSKGYTTEEMEKARLITVRGSRVYDYFFNRLMFPIFNTAGQTIAFGGRVMGQGEPKYLNSPETEVFNKRRNLYAMQLAKKSRRKEALMVEGYMDVLSLHQAGFDNAVASLGTALTQEQALLIKRYYNDVVLIYDSDKAGTQAARRGIPILEQAGLKVRVLRVPGAKDPDEFLKQNPPEAFQELIDQAMNPIDFEMLVLEEENNTGTVDGRVLTVNGMAERLAGIESDLERQIHIQDTAEKLKVDPALLAKKVEEIRRTTGLLDRRQNRPRTEEQGPRTDARMQLLGVMMHRQDLIPLLKRHISLEDLKGPDGAEDLYAQVAESLFRHQEQGSTVQKADLISLADRPEDQEKIARLVQMRLPETQEDLEKLLTETVRTVKRKALEEKLNRLTAEENATSEDLRTMQDIIYERKSLDTLRIRLRPEGGTLL